MFHVHFEWGKEQLEPILIEVYRATGVGLISYLNEAGESQCYTEVHIGERYSKTPRESIQEAFQLLNEKLREVAST